ncbi:hypothetical protein BDB01DRAFT_720486 [Pilobolus umbonatus]|nr:hypothetical protein BDB01DRAFT_720486 [Pilobolus umbonatus]
MAFKDLQFNINKLSTDVRHQIVRKNPLQDQDMRSLNLWLHEERQSLATKKTSTYHHSETDRAFLEWVEDETVKSDYPADVDDIDDIGKCLHTLLEKQVELDNQYNSKSNPVHYL